MNKQPSMAHPQRTSALVRLLIIAPLLIVANSGILSACAGPRYQATSTQQTFPQLIIQYHNIRVIPDPTWDAALSSAVGVELQVIRRLGAAYLYEVKAAPQNTTLQDILEDLNKNENIRYAEENRRVQRLQ